MNRVLTYIALGLVLCAGLLATAHAAEISSTPSSLSFGNVYIGKASGSKVLTITNISTGTVIINSVGFSCAGYGIASGVAPTSLFKPGDITHYSVFLQPTVAQSYNCNFVITLSDNSTLNVPLTGTGVQSNAVSSLSTTSVNFGSITQGATSATQSVTITNTGTAKLTLNAISVVPVNYVVAPVTLPASISAGSSLTLSLTYSPTKVQTDNGVLDLTYNEVKDNAVNLTGSGTTPTAISVTTLALLPQATTNSAWQVQLTSAGGKAPVNWGISTGSVLPKGLKGNKSGLITRHSGLLGCRWHLYLQPLCQGREGSHREQNLHLERLRTARHLQLQQHLMERP